ncbi:MAG: HlyD family efflux transporter periplasmic adaptor subunit, partial [Chloroflexi bacterium]|nr:HlyD family efflux transporter periplasmic adaptor subunit [Chloroflexota bacterium]
MRKAKLLIYLMLITVSITAMLAGCSSGPAGEQQTVAVVQSGDLEIKADVDGYIETPASVNLYFDTTMFTSSFSSRIRKIYVQKGDMVHAGALLAKLDDTGQKLTVENAQYALEQAINNVVQTGCCGTGRYPSFYADSVALLRYEFALKEMTMAKEFLYTDQFEEAAEQLTLAKSDVDGVQAYYTNPDYKQLRIEYNALDQAVESSPDLAIAIDRLMSEIDIISGLQQQVEAGQYIDAQQSVQDLLSRMSDTHTVVKRITHLPTNITYPDSATAYTVVSELTGSLATLQELADSKDFDAVKFSERLSMARHDLELSAKILEENISINRLGVNIKTLRDYNIAIQTAVINLQRAKQALLKTELIAPFDGRVEDINLRAGDMISQRYTTTGAPIDSYIIRLADTSYIRMTGTADEIDAVKIKAGQKARIFVDAAPGKQFDGTVKFISNYGPLQASGGIQYYGTIQPTVATYKVEIEMDRQQTVGLYGGLTASAEILIDSRSDVLIVPNGAVSGKNGEYIVRVLKDEKTNVIEQRQVKIGVQTRSQTEIVSG